MFASLSPISKRMETLLSSFILDAGREGGYIWLAGDEVKQLEAVLVSLETISGGEVSGQEKSLDLETYPFDHAENEPSPDIRQLWRRRTINTADYFLERRQCVRKNASRRR